MPGRRARPSGRRRSSSRTARQARVHLVRVQRAGKDLRQHRVGAEDRRSASVIAPSRAPHRCGTAWAERRRGREDGEVARCPVGLEPGVRRVRGPRDRDARSARRERAAADRPAPRRCRCGRAAAIRDDDAAGDDERDLRRRRAAERRPPSARTRPRQRTPSRPTVDRLGLRRGTLSVPAPVRRSSAAGVDKAPDADGGERERACQEQREQRRGSASAERWSCRRARPRRRPPRPRAAWRRSPRPPRPRARPRWRRPAARRPAWTSSPSPAGRARRRVPASAGAAPELESCLLFEVPFVAASSWARAMMSRQLPYWSASAGNFASASRYSFCV